MIETQQHVLTIRPTGKVEGQVVAKSVVVLGQVNGSITGQKVRIAESGSGEGVIEAPRGSHSRRGALVGPGRNVGRPRAVVAGSGVRTAALTVEAAQGFPVGSVSGNS